MEHTELVRITAGSAIALLVGLVVWRRMRRR